MPIFSNLRKNCFEAKVCQFKSKFLIYFFYSTTANFIIFTSRYFLKKLTKVDCRKEDHFFNS